MKFINEVEIIIYIEKQKIRQKKGYLTCSEREQLTRLAESPKQFIVTSVPENPNLKPILINAPQLYVACKPIMAGEDITQIIKELKTTLENSGGLGLSANQIGYNKQIAAVKIPKIDSEKKKVDFTEIVLINPQIIEHKIRIELKNEMCLSIPNIKVNTDRWVYITVVNYNEHLEANTFCSQDLESFVIQHEIAHLRGRTIFDDKHKKR
jgi:peptide deformylase